MTTPSAPASPLADAAAVLITEDIMEITVDRTVGRMDITVDHTVDHMVGRTGTNAMAAGADAVVEVGEVAEATAEANEAPAPGPPAAIST